MDDPNDPGELADVIHDAYDGSPAEIALAVLAAIQETHAIVPLEPTSEMLEAARFEGEAGIASNRSIYTAMIEAAGDKG